jgi:peroxisomal 2,4-dienoyl-CoA reductase
VCGKLGTYNTIKATLPHVRATKGSYIHVSTTLHYRGTCYLPFYCLKRIKKFIGTPYQVHVSAAKAAVDATSAVLAVEEGPRGVRSNVIAPGPIGGTEGMDRLTPKGREDSWPVPTGRKGESRDVANAAVFLFSDAASFISGQILVVDGASQHVRGPMLPYPQSVLDPTSYEHLIKPRL